MEELPIFALHCVGSKCWAVAPSRDPLRRESVCIPVAVLCFGSTSGRETHCPHEPQGRGGRRRVIHPSMPAACLPRCLAG
jgi:hypothetical protein